MTGPDSPPPSVIAAYEALLACYRSGQISERQWTEHLKDEAFAAFVRRVVGAV